MIAIDPYYGHGGHCGISNEELEALERRLAIKAVSAAEAARLLRDALLAMEASTIPIQEKNPKKPQFFQRDVIPGRKRRFGKR